jgi:hypothetical protein
VKERHAVDSSSPASSSLELLYYSEPPDTRVLQTFDFSVLILPTNPHVSQAPADSSPTQLNPSNQSKFPVLNFFK